jgi:ankyrin repeat protein
MQVRIRPIIVGVLVGAILSGAASAQTGPGASEVAAYDGLLAAAATGDVAKIGALIAAGANPDVRDGFGRTPLMVTAFRHDVDAARALLAAGADVDALERQRYDALTIAAVEDDLAMVELLIAGGANTGQTTSPYDGTALIASAHLGHVAVVEALIAGGAPLDHVNNLNWTALIEAIVLGDGGPDHLAIVRALLDAGADPNLADGAGARPLLLAGARGYEAMATAIRAAGGHP